MQFRSLVGKIPWNRNWQPTPGFLPGKFHRQRSLAGCSPWDRKELDMSEQIMILERSESINKSFDTFYMENYDVLEIV